MTKQEQFLWIVQTAILANGIRLASRVSNTDLDRDDYLTVGARELMADAIEASAMIPADMTARDAADDFCLWMINNRRGELERRAKSAEEKPEPPAWFVRY